MEIKLKEKIEENIIENPDDNIIQKKEEEKNFETSCDIKNFSKLVSDENEIFDILNLAPDTVNNLKKLCELKSKSK